MYIVTGGAGFIGSALIWRLNMAGVKDILVVDNLGEGDKWRNLVPLRYEDYLHKDEFLSQLKSKGECFKKVKAVVHLGACSATTERDADYLMENNYRYTKTIAMWAIAQKARFVYASSAATYGNGSLGFSDDDETSAQLAPINMYGYSKQLFDLWAIRHNLTRKIAGIKFFNVFGPNEYHKGEMRSVVHKAYHQIESSGEVKLFRSYRSEYPDGGQRRDFIYVKDCVEVLWRLLVDDRSVCGIFNLGTGKARSWNELASATFAAMGLPVRINYVEMPASIRGQYQYYTQAKMAKLRTALQQEIAFTSLEEAIADYVGNYLRKEQQHLS